MYYWYPVYKSGKDGTLIAKQLFLEYVSLITPTPRAQNFLFMSFYWLVSLNFIPLLRVVIRGENDSKQSDEFQATDWSFYVGNSYSIFLFRNFSHVFLRLLNKKIARKRKELRSSPLGLILCCCERASNWAWIFSGLDQFSSHSSPKQHLSQGTTLSTSKLNELLL